MHEIGGFVTRGPRGNLGHNGGLGVRCNGEDSRLPRSYQGDHHPPFGGSDRLPLTGVGTARADSPPMTPHTASVVSLIDGLSPPLHRRSIACLAARTVHLHARSNFSRMLFPFGTAKIRFVGQPRMHSNSTHEGRASQLPLKDASAQRAGADQIIALDFFLFCKRPPAPVSPRCWR